MTRGKTMEDRQVSLKQMLDTVDEMPVMKDNNGMEFIEKSLVKTRLWLLPSAEPEIIYCKDCAKNGKELKTIPRALLKEEACPLINWRGKAQGHEFDYQYCVYAKRRTSDGSD